MGCHWLNFCLAENQYSHSSCFDKAFRGRDFHRNADVCDLSIRAVRGFGCRCGLRSGRDESGEFGSLGHAENLLDHQVSSR